MNGLLEKLLTLPELRELAAEVHKTRCCAAVTGLSPYTAPWSPQRWQRNEAPPASAVRR